MNTVWILVLVSTWAGHPTEPSPMEAFSTQASCQAMVSALKHHEHDDPLEKITITSYCQQLSLN